ncbi:hypothetical protein CASFOL_002562 [Castilleja foliolosa]|uniref:ENTH domain-containing protein n=1 Tax=Castilleja foliolosa TaxID=1961234 RepID=A0ABD3EEX8_9LAMI
MRLWERASGVLKDQNSLWQANLTRRTALRNPEIEKAVIRATTHDELSFDTRHADRVCDWLRLSPFNLKPILWSLSNRVEKTSSWVVALKCLYLTHALTATRTSSVRKIGRLPFDLSSFTDAHFRPARSWSFNSFIRAYYAFLDHKSTAIFQSAAAGPDEKPGFSIARELSLLQKLQALVDLVMQIKPQARAAHVPLVLHVMDGIIVEIYDLYSRICRGIAVVLLNIYSGGKAEAAMSLAVVKKAMRQGEDLMRYFEFCQEIGVVNASDFPAIDRIPDEGIRELEEIIISLGEKNVPDQKEDPDDLSYDEKAVVVYDKGGMKTIITDDWERFEDDCLVTKSPLGANTTKKLEELPDLISF